jgi:hypothetical protein
VLTSASLSMRLRERIVERITHRPNGSTDPGLGQALENRTEVVLRRRRSDGSPHPNRRPAAATGPDRVLDRIEHQWRRHRGRGARAQDHPGPTRSTHMSCRRPTADSLGVRAPQRCCLPVGIKPLGDCLGSMLTVFSVGADRRGGEYSRDVPGVAGCGIGHTRSVRSLSRRRA